MNEIVDMSGILAGAEKEIGLHSKQIVNLEQNVPHPDFEGKETSLKNLAQMIKAVRNERATYAENVKEAREASKRKTDALVAVKKTTEMKAVNMDIVRQEAKAVEDKYERDGSNTGKYVKEMARAAGNRQLVDVEATLKHYANDEVYGPSYAPVLEEKDSNKKLLLAIQTTELAANDAKAKELREFRRQREEELSTKKVVLKRDLVENNMDYSKALKARDERMAAVIEDSISIDQLDGEAIDERREEFSLIETKINNSATARYSENLKYKTGSEQGDADFMSGANRAMQKMEVAEKTAVAKGEVTPTIFTDDERDKFMLGVQLINEASLTRDTDKMTIGQVLAERQLNSLKARIRSLAGQTGANNETIGFVVESMTANLRTMITVKQTVL